MCVPARYTIRTGCELPTTRVFTNQPSPPAPGQAKSMEGRCGAYLARTMKSLGYRTFGIGKFHTTPRNEDLGFDVQLYSEELYNTPEDASATTTPPGSPRSTPPSTTSRTLWASGLRCTICRKSVRCPPS